MNTYIINLKESTERKRYMESVLKPYEDFLNIRFIEAVNGKNFSEEQIKTIWNQTGTFQIYGRFMRNTEIGCALSHRKCCEEMLKSGEEIALIVEDDLVWQNTNLKKTFQILYDFLHTEKPVVVLLSGDYWFTRRKKINDLTLATVREAVCAQAYMLNRSAAEKIIAMKRNYLADDWYHIKKQGIDLYGVYPHIADQNRKNFQTVISTAYEGTIRKNLSLGNRVHSYYRAIVKRILANTGHKERKNFLE